MSSRAAYYREYRRKQKALKLQAEDLERRKFQPVLFEIMEPQLENETAQHVANPSATPKRNTTSSKKTTCANMVIENATQQGGEDMERNNFNPTPLKLVPSLGEDVAQHPNATVQQGEVPSATQQFEPENSATLRNRQQQVGATTAQHSKPVAQQLGLGLRALVFLFVVLNTAFLVSEQQYFYVSAGYQQSLAWILATLTELGLLVLSAAASALPVGPKKTTLYALLAAGVFLMGALTSGGTEHRTASKVQKNALESESIVELNQQIDVLAQKEKQAMAVIASFDPEKYRSKVAQLQAELDQGYSQELAKLREEKKQLMSQPEIGNELSESTKWLKWQRWLQILWGVVLVGFLRKPSL